MTSGHRRRSAHQVVRAPIGRRPCLPAGRGRRGHGAARPERLRQDHDSSHSHRLPAPVVRNRPHRRARRRGRRAGGAGPSGLRPRGRPALRLDERPRISRLHGQAQGARRPGGRGIGRGRHRAPRPRRRPAHPHRQALARVPSARRRRPGPPGRSGPADPRRAHQRARPAPDHRDAGPHPGAGGRAHRPRHLPHPRRDRAGRRPGGDPARRAGCSACTRSEPGARVSAPDARARPRGRRPRLSRPGAGRAAA